MSSVVQLHASCVAVHDKGVLLLGHSGSGKSDLALRLIDAGAVLVADDRVDIVPLGAQLAASAPAALQGMLEVRGVGILHIPCQSRVVLSYAIKLGEQTQQERMPSPQFFDCLNIKLPLHSMHAFEPSAVAKIHALLRFPLVHE